MSRCEWCNALRREAALGFGGVAYLTLNVQGSCNNLCDTAPDPTEWAARNQANIVWLRESFRFAAARQSVAVMIVAQANPGWDATDGTRARP